MRRIEHTRAFKRDFKRVRSTPKHRDIEERLSSIVPLLAADAPLPAHHLDHALTGNWKDHRDCHIKPDLIPIYRKPAPDVLQLVRPGSHSRLGL